jgi:hypothetical protein
MWVGAVCVCVQLPAGAVPGGSITRYGSKPGHPAVLRWTAASTRATGSDWAVLLRRSCRWLEAMRCF